MLIMCTLFLIISCGERPAFHLADLKQSLTPSSEIILFKDALDIESSESSHNVVPPHGKVEKDRTMWFLDESCIEVGRYKFCSDNDRMNSRLKMSVISGNSRIQARPLGGSFYDIWYRFMGASPASVHEIVKFGNESFGLLHTHGFSVFYNGKFCEPIEVNPNGKMWFGMDNRGALLIFTSSPLTDVDRPVDGWREYEIARLCQ